MSIKISLRVHGHTVTRAELEAFIGYLHDLGSKEAWVYVDDADGDAIVLEARQDPSGEG